MARVERSAGVVVFRMDRRAQRPLYLLLDYGRYWDHPKGHVEAGEDDRAAALRELAEETGIADARIIDGFARTIEYFFRGPKKGLIRKRVAFFLAHTTTKSVRLSDEHVGSAWLDFDQAMRTLKYATARQVLREANEFVQAQG